MLPVRYQRSGARRRLALLAVPLLAAAGPAARAAGPTVFVDSTPIGVKATRACFSDDVRVTGYVVARRETGVALDREGFRVTEVLAGEGDAVAADQELVRLARIADPLAPPAPQAPAGAPATLSLRAPAAGTILRSTARVGALTRAGAEPLMRIVVDPEFDLLVEVPSLYAAKVRAGAAARVLLGEGTEVAGNVRVPATDVDPASQFGRARLSLTRNPALRYGLFARALVDTDRSCGVAVPRSAVLRQNDVTSVQVMKDGRLETRPIKVGLSSDENVEVREGLAEGETVVSNAGMAF